MKRIIISVFTLLILCAAINAQGWEKSFDLSFNMTQSNYSDSWSGGEAGNITWVARADGIFEKQLKPKFNYRLTLKLAFGQTHTQDKDTKEWARPEKSTDKIDIENLGRFTFGGYVDPYVALRYESQFVDASVENIKRYLNPMLFTESAGISRTFYKTEEKEVLSRLGIALKERITSVIADTVADERDWETEIDGGIESVTDVKYTLSENILYLGKLTLYKALMYSDKDEVKGTPEEDYWKAVDVNFENTFSASVSKYISVSLYFQLLYDKQIDVRGRFKQTLALGVTYKLL